MDDQDHQRCRLCGLPASGWAFVDNGAGFQKRLCHGGEQRISCYVRWTVYGERPKRAGDTDDPKGKQ